MPAKYARFTWYWIFDKRSYIFLSERMLSDLRLSVTIRYGKTQMEWYMSCNLKWHKEAPHNYTSMIYINHVTSKMVWDKRKSFIWSDLLFHGIFLQCTFAFISPTFFIWAVYFYPGGLPWDMVCHRYMHIRRVPPSIYFKRPILWCSYITVFIFL